MQPSSVFIFTGPTLSPEIGQKYLDACYLPPVKYGDIYQLIELYQPKVIGIIDGYFNQVPAVWHKEILWAMNQGTAVFGAASMGALRATELNQYGMHGCGEIFAAYQRGILPPYNSEPFEDDDEVAVIHSPAELGYIAASEAMVNIRYSFAKAVQQGVIDQHTCQQLAGIAKSLFYADRQYSTIFERALQQSVPASTVSALKQWLKLNSVDQKRADALCLLENIKDHIDNSAAQIQETTETFEHTSQWQSAMEEIALSHAISHPALQELRVKGPKYFETLEKALDSALASEGSSEKLELSDTKDTFYQFHRTPSKLQSLFAQKWQSKENRTIANQLSQSQCEQILLKYLDQIEQLKAYEARAKDKEAQLTKLEPKPTLDSLTEIDKLQLADWFFTQKLELEMPNKIDQYALELGFVDLDEFYAMILGEYLYQDVKSTNGSPSTS